MVAWIGVGLDAAQVASAVAKVAKAEVTIADAAKELAADARRLGMTEEELLAKLRSLAGDIDGAAKVTEGAKGMLAGKLGLPVDIDPKLAGDVRVFYEVDKATGRVTVKSLVAGPEATMAEVLAHERLIQHMRRYEGVTGRLRELWEKLLAFAGKSPTDKNPFPAGSKAWESWNELYKLPDVVDAQLLKYRDGLRAGNEATLVKDLEILEDQARRHRSIIDEMVGEAGAGFVAKTGDSTRAAIAAGYPLPAGVSTAEELLAKGYYYRAGANGRYDLVRKTSAGVDQLRVELDAAGKPVGLVKAVEKLETRIAEAAQLQRLRALASDAEIARLYDKVGDAARLEKLLEDTGGVAKLEALLGKFANLPEDLANNILGLSIEALERFGKLGDDVLRRYAALGPDALQKLGKLEPKLLKKLADWDPKYFEKIGQLDADAIAFIAKLDIAPGQDVVNALGSFSGHRMQFGSLQFLLDKKGMKHFLERHHPQYWDGSVKVPQSFFDPKMTVDEIKEAIDSIMRANRDKLMKKGTNGMFQITGEWNNRLYVVGLNNGRVGQFYPVR